MTQFELVLLLEHFVCNSLSGMQFTHSTYYYNPLQQYISLIAHILDLNEIIAAYHTTIAHPSLISNLNTYSHVTESKLTQFRRYLIQSLIYFSNLTFPGICTSCYIILRKLYALKHIKNVLVEFLELVGDMQQNAPYRFVSFRTRCQIWPTACNLFFK